jgi:thiol-disulfide isomerase/thioredoxin
MFLSPAYVNLKGKETLTIIKNSTPDTLRWTGEFFSDLPYAENPFKVTIAPGRQDTLKFNFTYPDFIHIYGADYFRLFNSPGKVLQCDVQALTSRSATIVFQGEMADVNAYYLAYHNHLGSKMESNRPYFELGDRMNDLNKFPRAADSISERSLDFLKRYEKPLPTWFKKHEEWRLKYYSAFLKYNVLHSKEFYGGKKIEVPERYFSSEKDLPFENREMILNNDYVWYLRSYINRRARSYANKNERRKAGIVPELLLADSVFKGTAAGDIYKMDRLSMLYRGENRSLYDSLFESTIFNDLHKKQILDSLVHVKYGLPALGKIVPELSLTDLSGKKASFRNYKGKYVMINFWATWCGPCIQEFPEENKLYLTNKDKGLIVINVCIDSNINQWKAVSEKKALKTINLFAEKEQYQYISNVFGISGLPKSILLGKDLSVLDDNFKRASRLTMEDVNRILNR